MKLGGPRWGLVFRFQITMLPMPTTGHGTRLAFICVCWRALNLFAVSKDLTKLLPGVGNPPALEIIQNKLQTVSGINIWASQSHGGFDCWAKCLAEGQVSRLTDHRLWSPFWAGPAVLFGKSVPKDSFGSYKANGPWLLGKALPHSLCVACDLLCESEASQLQGIQRDQHKPALTTSQSAPSHALHDSPTAHKITQETLSLALEISLGLAPALPPSPICCCFHSWVMSTISPLPWLWAQDLESESSAFN